MQAAEESMDDGRREFLERRRKGIGASDVGTLLGINPYQTPYELWLDKTGRIEPEDDSAVAKLGRVLERSLLDYAESELGALTRNVVVPHCGSPLVATLDGCHDGKPVETKTAGLMNQFADLSEWGDAGTDEVPAVYLCQVQAQLLCTGEEIAYMFALISGRGIVRYEIPAEPKLTSLIAERCTQWWKQHVIADTPPPLEVAPEPEVFKRVKREPNKVVDLSVNAAAWLHVSDRLRREIKEREKELKDMQSRVLAELGDAEAGNLPDGRVVTYFEQSRKGYTVEPKTFRVMRVKKGKQ